KRGHMEHNKTRELTQIGVIGTGSYLPLREVGNAEVGTPAGVDDEWIVRKTGIRSRRWADPGGLFISPVHSRGPVAPRKSQRGRSGRVSVFCSHSNGSSAEIWG